MSKMIENEAKGWHGSYSSVGRISAETFPMILIKDQILKGRYKKKKMKDYFSTEEDFNNYNKLIIDESDDIFNIEYKCKMKLRKKRKEICKPNTKKKIPEEYKYHNMHHKDLFNFKQRLKNQSDLSSTVYDAKKDFVWSRTLTGPQWNSLCGREKGGIFKSDIESITPINKLVKNIDNNKTKKNSIVFTPERGVPMEKMTKRGIIPIFYDLRIRNDKAFIKDNKTTNNINTMSKKEFHIKTNNEKPKSKKSIQILNFSKNNKSKKYSSPILIHTINFSKNLSREQYNHLNRNREGVRPFFNPKYDFVEPKSLTMVSYYKKPSKKSTSKRIKGINTNLFYDPDKVMNKINNHRENSVPLFKYSLNKIEEESKLPSHMNNIFNRGSLEIMTDKGLKMNSYYNSHMRNDYSTFCQKKSFNKIINYELLKIENLNDGISNLEKLSQKFGRNQRIKTMMEFYTKNLDDKRDIHAGNKFDSITLKSIKSKDLLNAKEKKLFNINFDN